jgi:hypothetical protein
LPCRCVRHLPPRTIFSEDRFPSLIEVEALLFAITR